MRKTTVLLPLLLAVAAALGAAVWRLYQSPRTLEIGLYLHPFVGPEPLVFNQPRYPNPGGEGRFQVRDFQFFLSNIRLVGASGEYAEPDSYHLVRFDGEQPTAVLLLRGIPRRDYQRLEFAIGVDAAANRSLAPRGDLDPNGRMAWTWEVGYKFVLVEGTLLRGDATQPLVYHVGFDESYRTISTELPAQPLGGHPARLDLRVDLLRLFQGSTAIDLAAIPSVKFDRADTARLAGNLGGLVTPMWPAPAAPLDRAR